MAEHKINLNQEAVAILTELVNAAGWAKTTSNIILGGGIAVKMPDLPARPSNAKKDEFKVWALKAVPEFVLSEKEREAVKTCLQHWTEQGAIPASAYSAELLKALGFE